VSDVTWVDDAAGLHGLVQALKGEPRVAFDTESNSMHAYRERICLVQLSWPGGDALVDPLSVDLLPLAAVLEDHGIQKVMHGADYDVLCLRRQLGVRVHNLFDTMIAARVLRWERCGLGSILEERFGVRADKRMQRFDWGLRPLPSDAIEYARQDTRWLLALADAQTEALELEPERHDVFAHACVRQAGVEPRPSVAVPDPWRIKGFRKLPAPERAIAAALAIVREAVAEELDRPLFKVMPDDVLLAMARKTPRDRREIASNRRLHPKLRRQHADRLLAAIEAGREAEAPEPPPEEPRPPTDVAQRFDALRAWRKALAETTELEPDLVISKAAMWSLAQANPQTPEALEAIAELDDWERARHGAAILEALRTARRS
jgi:ribonuclease D